MPVRLWNHDEARLAPAQVKEFALQAARLEVLAPGAYGEWDVAYREETRPGRGHSVIAWWGDSDHVATLYMDPYGYGNLVFADWDPIHADSDEEHHDENGDCEHFPATPQKESDLEPPHEPIPAPVPAPVPARTL